MSGASNSPVPRAGGAQPQPSPSTPRADAWLEAIGPIGWRDWVHQSHFLDDLAAQPRGTLARAWLEQHGMAPGTADTRVREADRLRAVQEAQERSLLEEREAAPAQRERDVLDLDEPEMGW